MATSFPHTYTVTLDGDDRHGVLQAMPRPDIVGGPPQQFGSSSQWWSPEELLVGSAALCLQATFQFVARRERLPYRRFMCRAEGTLDKTASGLAFSAIRLVVSLDIDAELGERAAAVLDVAKRQCIISNSLKTPVTVELALAAPVSSTVNVA